MTSSQYLSSEKSEHLPRSAFESVNVPKIYDELGLDYEKYILEDEGRAKTIQWVTSRVSEHVKSQRDEGIFVVDLGCASGRPTVETIATAIRDLEAQQQQKSDVPEAAAPTKHTVMGVDVSPVQLAHARERITAHNPIAQFTQGDMRTWSPSPSPSSGTIDAVLSFYALNHLPLEDYRTVVQRAASWLRPGGVLGFGTAAHVNGRVKWLGYDVAATSLTLDEIVTLVEGAGCTVCEAWEEDWKSATREGAKGKRNQFVWAVKV